MINPKQDYFITSCLIRKKFEHSDSYLGQSYLNSFSTLSHNKKKSHPNSINNNYSVSRFNDETSRSLLPSLNINRNSIIKENSINNQSQFLSTTINETQRKLTKICENEGKIHELFTPRKEENENVEKKGKITLKAPIKTADKSLEFNQYLEVLKKRGADKNLTEKFRIPRKKSTTLGTVLKKFKMSQIFKRGTSKRETYQEKIRKFATLQRKVANKSPKEIIQDLIELLELLRDTFGSSTVSLSHMRVLQGFKDLENVFVEPASQEFKMSYTMKRLHKEEMLGEEQMKKILVFRSELHTFMKKKQMEMAELKAGLMEEDFDELKIRTFGYLENLKYKNKKRYNDEKNFLVETLDFIYTNQINNKFKLNSLREIEATEKNVGKFEKINEINRMKARALDYICQKTGF